MPGVQQVIDAYGFDLPMSEGNNDVADVQETNGAYFEGNPVGVGDADLVK